MKKCQISSLFFYRHRFLFGYIFLSLIFLALIFSLPFFALNGLSSAEMSSAATSYNLHFSSITTGDLVDLPYHLVQKVSILIFGFNAIAIKLPSIIIAILLGLLLVLLLNRWFKNNVALLSSILTILSTPFLYLAGTGTPLIMLLFWPTVLLWLGSKIQGIKKPRAIFSLIFAFLLLLSVFTPHMFYLAGFIVIYAFLKPHLRFTIKNLPRLPFILTSLVVAAGLILLCINIFSNPSVPAALFGSEHPELFWTNLGNTFSTLFSWQGLPESTFLAPLISLPVAVLAFLGLLSTVHGFFASRNAIASYFTVFSIVFSGLNPDSIVLLILPIAILTAHGFRYILDKWYNLFPTNPYARVFGLLPLALYLALVLIPGLVHFIYGYHYIPSYSASLSTDLALIDENLPENTILYLERDADEYDFYEAYEDRHHKIFLTSALPTAEKRAEIVKNSLNPDFNSNNIQYFATLGLKEDFDAEKLYRIIPSPKSDNSDRIYIYNFN